MFLCLHKQLNKEGNHHKVRRKSAFSGYEFISDMKPDPRYLFPSQIFDEGRDGPNLANAASEAQKIMARIKTKEVRRL